MPDRATSASSRANRARAAQHEQWRAEEADLRDRAHARWETARDTAPRDRTPFIGHFGWPWLLLTMWNPPSENWACATVQIGLYQGEWNDTYFETDHETADSLLGWLPLPTPPDFPAVE